MAGRGEIFPGLFFIHKELGELVRIWRWCSIYGIINISFLNIWIAFVKAFPKQHIRESFSLNRKMFHSKLVIIYLTSTHSSVMLFLSSFKILLLAVNSTHVLFIHHHYISSQVWKFIILPTVRISIITSNNMQTLLAPSQANPFIHQLGSNLQKRSLISDIVE